MSRTVPRNDIYSRVNALERQVSSLASALAGNAWIGVAATVGYATHWSDFGSGWPGVAYRRVGDIVYLRGLAGQSGGTVGSAVFTLPAGYRPPAGNGVDLIAISAGGVGNVDITTAGVVSLSAGTANNFLSFDGLSFSIT